MIKTDCVRCVHNFSSNPNEVICGLSRYQIFEERGLTDGTIINALCTACRDEEWAKRGVSIDDELKNVYSLVIVDNGGPLMENLEKTLSEQQEISPREIVFVYQQNFPMSTISKRLQEYVDGTTTKISISKVLDNEYDRFDIDFVVKNLTGLFYTVIENGKILPNDFLLKIFDYTEIRLNKLAMVRPISGLTGLTVIRVFHHYVNGNFQKTVEEKMEEAAQIENNHHLIKNWEELCG